MSFEKSTAYIIITSLQEGTLPPVQRILGGGVRAGRRPTLPKRGWILGRLTVIEVKPEN